MLLPKEIIRREIARTNPDRILFYPKRTEYEIDNVHLHVIKHPCGKLFAVWTQSAFDDYGNNHAVFSIGSPDGKIWTEPKYIVGCTEDNSGDDTQASWAVPVMSRSGKIYLIYLSELDNANREEGGFCGIFKVISTTDLGQTWSKPTIIEAPVTPRDYSRSQRNVIFQIPTRLSHGRVLVGFTKWTSLRLQNSYEHWYEQDSRVCFFRLENLDEDPDVANLRYTFLPESSDIILPLPSKPSVSVAQEPSIVKLPDGRLFCALRTALGYAAYSLSNDNGTTWSVPKPICFTDGSLLAHPLSPCPMYEIGEGRYALLYHGHAEDVGRCRNPLFRAVGHYAPDAEQPIAFETSESELFMRLPDDASIPSHEDNQLAIYGSVCEVDGHKMLWYPERKCFLLGKILDN